MSEWENKASDIQIVERFQNLHERKHRVRSLWSYRMQIKGIYPRLLKILIDGLEHQQQCKLTHDGLNGSTHANVSEHKTEGV